MSFADNLKKVPFTVKIQLVVFISYVIIIGVGYKIYSNNNLFLENLHAVSSIDDAQAKAKELVEQNNDWVLYGLGTCIVVAQILLFLVVQAIHNLMDKTLRGVSRRLQGASSDMAAISSEVSHACTVLAEGTSEQAAAIEQTTSSLEELTGMANQNTQNVHAAKGRANDARLMAEAGLHEMQEMTQIMNSMQGAGQELDHSMEEIKHSGDAISKIIKTIDEIAFQTNILALNAAVEAARAGEAGMGFAVVADEVRNLAKRSADAARETSTLIENSIRKSDQGVTMSQKVSTSLKQIIESSRVVDKRLEEIVGKVREVDTYMNQVTESSEQQSTGVQQITKAVHQMDKVTQSSAASSQQTAASAIELHSQADILKLSVQELLELVGGASQTRDEFQMPASRHHSLSSERSEFAPPPLHRPAPIKQGTIRPTVKLRSTRIPKEAPLTSSNNPTGSPRLEDKNKSIPMDDFKDF